MTKEELLLGFAQWVKDGEWDYPKDYFDQFGLSCERVNSYVVDADDKGYEQYEVYFVSNGSDLEFHFIISWGGGRWEEMDTALFEAFPKQVTRYNVSLNYVDMLEENLLD